MYWKASWPLDNTRPIKNKQFFEDCRRSFTPPNKRPGVVAPCREVVLSWKWMVFQSGSNLLVDNILQFPTSRWWVNRTILVSRLDESPISTIQHRQTGWHGQNLQAMRSWSPTCLERTGNWRLWLIDLQVDRGSQILVYRMLSIWFCSQMLGPQPPRSSLDLTIRQDLLRPTWVRRKELQRGLLGSLTTFMMFILQEWWVMIGQAKHARILLESSWIENWESSAEFCLKQDPTELVK